MEAAAWLDLTNSESPEFVGRAVASLAADPNVMRHTGTVQVAARLAMSTASRILTGRPLGRSHWQTFDRVDEEASIGDDTAGQQSARGRMIERLRDAEKAHCGDEARHGRSFHLLPVLPSPYNALNSPGNEGARRF